MVGPSEPPRRVETASQSPPPVPATGDWPCQQNPVGKAYPRLTAFMYRLLRDGAAAPGDVENHAIQAGRSDDYPVFTNPHLEQYANALIAHLLPEA